jgi:ABC-type phosphate/phosphonate transport system substrate-binding protein
MVIPPYSGSLRKSLQQVLNGDVDAAGIGDEILDLAVMKGEIPESEIQIIYSSPSIPGSLFVVRNSDDKVPPDRVKKAVLAMNNIPFCKIGLIHTMELAKDSDYEIVREMIEGVQDI